MDNLKQAEIFAFLAALFLIAIVFVEKQRLENPPTILISEEREEFRFQSGSANLSDSFKVAIEEKLIPQLEHWSTKYRCDVVEIIGYTDTVPVANPKGGSNLDRLDSLADKLKAGSNTDLGMMRALAVLGELKTSQSQGRLNQIELFLPYSAGQFVDNSYRLTIGEKRRADASRRRIEIRLTRSSESFSHSKL